MNENLTQKKLIHHGYGLRRAETCSSTAWQTVKNDFIIRHVCLPKLLKMTGWGPTLTFSAVIQIVLKIGDFP